MEKSDFWILLTIICAGIAIILTPFLHADTGSEGAIRKEEGSYAAMRIVTLSSTTGTAIFSSSVKRPDGICRFFAPVVWIGTVSATRNNMTHDNITYGFPVYSTETFKLDGSFTGNLYGTADTGVSSVNGRCLDGLVQ